MVFDRFGLGRSLDYRVHRPFEVRWSILRQSGVAALPVKECNSADAVFLPDYRVRKQTTNLCNRPPIGCRRYNQDLNSLIAEMAVVDRRCPERPSQSRLLL